MLDDHLSVISGNLLILVFPFLIHNSYNIKVDHRRYSTVSLPTIHDNHTIIDEKIYQKYADKSNHLSATNDR